MEELSGREESSASRKLFQKLEAVLVFRGQAGIWSWLRLCCSALGLYSTATHSVLKDNGRPCLHREAVLAQG